MVDVRVRLLGPVDVTVDGVVRAVSGVRRKAVLAALGLRHGEVVGADRLIEVVWGGRPPVTAVNTLQSHVSYLRRVLGWSGAIVARGSGYVLDLGAEGTDVLVAEGLIERGRGAGDPGERVAGLEAALGLWRGRPLADVGDVPWFADEAERLERVRRVAEQARVEAGLALGGHVRLAPELEELCARHPFDEDLHGLLMVALYRGGRQADALAAYQRLRVRLRDELGIDPGAPLRELEAAILRQDPALDLAVAGAVEVAAGPVLVERADETALIDQALDRAVSRKSGGVLLFEGPGGIGKTSVLDYARGRAELRGFATVSARGSELEVEYDWGCVRQLFERFAGIAAPGTSAFLRSSDAIAPTDPSAGGASAPRGDYPIINSLFWLVSDLASRNPLLIVLDDLHWADLSSVRFLAYLAARLDELPCVVMVALRPGIERVEHIVSVMAGLPHSVGRTLQALTPEGSAALLAEVIDERPDDRLVARCHEATRGNPFLLRELGRELAQGQQGQQGQRPESSPSIARFVARQLRLLPSPATIVARTLAVLGDDVGSDLLAQVTRMPQHQVLDALSALVTGELVRAHGTPSRFSFAHPMIRTAVYEAVPPGLRAATHLHAAEAAMRNNDPVRAATHLLRVPPGMGDLDTVAILEQATESSLAGGSVDGAVAFLRRILEEDLGERRLEVLTRLGMTEALVDMPRSIEHLSQALALQPDQEQRAQLAHIVASTQWMVGRPREAALICQAALERDVGMSASARQALQACIGMVANGTRHGHDLIALYESFTDQTPDSSVGGLMFEASLALHDSFRNRRSSAEEHALRVLKDDRLFGEAMGEATLTCAWYVLTICDHPGLLPSTEGALDTSRRTGSLRVAAPGFTYRAAYMLSRGHLEEAVHDGRLGWEAAKNSGLSLGMSFVGNWLMIALVERDEIDAAQSILDQIRAARRPGLTRMIYADGELSLLLAQGRMRQAYETALAVRDECRMSKVTNPTIFDWAGPLARCLHRFGRAEEARAVATDALDGARAWGAPRTVGRALRTLAAVESGEQAIKLLAESVQVLENTEARLEHAHSRYALGEALREAGRLDEARAHLLEAVDLSAYCGARPLHDRAATALALAGGHTGPGTARAAIALTPTEERVAELAATGRTDREIAESLYLSIKAVREHREAITRKRGDEPGDDRERGGPTGS